MYSCLKLILKQSKIRTVCPDDDGDPWINSQKFYKWLLSMAQPSLHKNLWHASWHNVYFNCYTYVQRNGCAECSHMLCNGYMHYKLLLCIVVIWSLVCGLQHQSVHHVHLTIPTFCLIFWFLKEVFYLKQFFI